MFLEKGYIKRLSKPYLPAVVSGALLVLCFPVFDYYSLAWVSLVPFLVSLWEKTPRQGFKAGFLLGVVFFSGTLYWIYHSINHYGGVSLVPSLALVFLLSLYLSLYTGVFGWLFSLKIKTTPFPALFLAPVFWVVLEFARSYALTGFPWSSLGYSQYKFLSVIQVADITGIYGISFLVVAVNGAIADLFIIKKRRQEMPLFHMSPTIIGYGILLLGLIAVFGYGYYRLDQDRGEKTIRVSVVQGNIRQDIKWDPGFQRDVINTYKRLTTTASLHQPSLIVWPETAVPFYFGKDIRLTEELIEFQKNLEIPLLFGAITVKDGNRLANSAVLLDSTGEVSYIYDKIHLVPFGEYVPFRRILFFVDKIAYGIGEYVAGDKYLRAETPFGKFGTFICYEIIFPGLVRKFYKDDGDFIVTITNDAWFGKTAGPYQHFSMAVLRAVENRKPVIRAANTGISGFIDSSGRILSSTGLFKQQVLTANITTDRTRSFYSRYGDLFSYLCIIITVILLMDLRRR
jgi:apolipoprotein N-acyltransferase